MTTRPSTPDHTERARAIVDGLTAGPASRACCFTRSSSSTKHTDPDASSGFGGPTLRELIADRGIRFFCLGSIPDPAATRASPRAPSGDRPDHRISPSRRLLHRPPALVHAERRSRPPGAGRLAMAREPRPRRHRRRRPGPPLRRHRPPRLPRDGHPDGAAPAGRPRPPNPAGRGRRRASARTRRRPARLLTAFLEGLQGRDLGPRASPRRSSTSPAADRS